MNTPNLDEVLREYKDDGGSMEVYEGACLEIDAYENDHASDERAIAALLNKLAALRDLLAAVRETRHMGSFAVPAHIKAALELYEEQTKGQTT